MGSVRFGIPRELALALKAKHGIEDFVETGTLVGHTAEWAAEHFKRVVTVDVDKDQYLKTAGPLVKQHPNIEAFWDHSPWFLSGLSINYQPVLFWLDAHTNDECPVLDEIAVINKSRLTHVILVDDARLFGELPAWPTKAEVVEALSNGGKRTVYEVEDVLVAEPCP
jgi:hypothetical protein